MEKKRNKKNRDNKELNAKMEALQNSLKKLETEKLKRESNVKIIKNTLNDNDMKHKKMIENVNALKNNFVILQNQTQNLKNKNNKINDKNQSLIKQLNLKQNTFNQTKLKLLNFETQIKDLNSQIQGFSQFYTFFFE